MGQLKCTRQSRKGIYELGDAQMASLQLSSPAPEVQSSCPKHPRCGAGDAMSHVFSSFSDALASAGPPG